MAKIKDKEIYPNQFPVNPKTYFIGTDPSGKTVTVEASSIIGQFFNLELLGNSCIQYPVTYSTDCETGAVTQLPLQLVQVLLALEQQVCKNTSAIATIQEECCDGCETITTTILVYDENTGTPTEWKASEINPNSGITIGSVTAFQNGISSIALNGVSNNISAQILFEAEQLQLKEDLINIKFHIKHNTASIEQEITAPYAIRITFLKDNTQGAQSLNVSEGIFGFSMTNIGFTEITIPLFDELFPAIDFNKIIFSVFPLNNTTLVNNLFIDNISLTKEVTDCSGLPADNLLPIVDAGVDQVITLGENQSFTDVNLTAIASDPDGTIVSYLWTQISGNTVTIDDPTIPNAVPNDLPVGTYVFQVTVTDNDGATASDTVQITVYPFLNIIPVANAGVDQTTQDIEITLDGSLSADTDGTIVTYLWTQISGGATTITSPNSETTTVTGFIEGSYVFQLQVTDDDGATHTDTVTINITEQPVAKEILIDLGSCLAPADFENQTAVFIAELPSVIALGDVDIVDGDILYTDSGLSIPFNGGGNSYMYERTSPATNEAFFVSATGVVSSHESCSAPLTIESTFDYNGADTTPQTESPSGSYFIITAALLTSVYTGSNPIDSIKLFSIPNIGDLGLVTDTLNTGDSVDLALNINATIRFYARGLIDGVGNAQENNGDFTTSFVYGIVDNTNTVIDIVEYTFNANDTTN